MQSWLSPYQQQHGVRLHQTRVKPLPKMPVNPDTRGSLLRLLFYGTHTNNRGSWERLGMFHIHIHNCKAGLEFLPHCLKILKTQQYKPGCPCSSTAMCRVSQMLTITISLSHICHCYPRAGAFHPVPLSSPLWAFS